MPLIDAALFFDLLLALLAMMLVTFSTWGVLHIILCHRLDPILYKEPHFYHVELSTLSFWPFSFLRSALYMGLIVIPSSLKKRRFKTFNDELPVGPALSLACKITLMLMLTSGVLAACLLGYAGLVMLTDYACSSIGMFCRDDYPK